jgi:hypothetical protein
LKSQKTIFTKETARLVILPILEKQANIDQQNRDRGHKDAIQAKAVNNCFYDHLRKNLSHEIDLGKGLLFRQRKKL